MSLVVMEASFFLITITVQVHFISSVLTPHGTTHHNSHNMDN